MNPTNEQELDNDNALMDKIDDILYGEHKQPYSRGDSLLMLIRNQIQAHTNAEIAKVLDRLEAELNEQKKAAETNLAYHVDVTKNERLIRDWQGTVHGIEFCRPAIAAERAK